MERERPESGAALQRAKGMSLEALPRIRLPVMQLPLRSHPPNFIAVRSNRKPFQMQAEPPAVRFELPPKQRCNKPLPPLPPLPPQTEPKKVRFALPPLPKQGPQPEHQMTLPSEIHKAWKPKHRRSNALLPETGPSAPRFPSRILEQKYLPGDQGPLPWHISERWKPKHRHWTPCPPLPPSMNIGATNIRRVTFEEEKIANVDFIRRNFGRQNNNNSSNTNNTPRATQNQAPSRTNTSSPSANSPSSLLPPSGYQVPVSPSHTANTMQANDQAHQSNQVKKNPPFFFREEYAGFIVKGNFMTLAAKPALVEEGEWMAHQGWSALVSAIVYLANKIAVTEQSRLLGGMIKIMQTEDRTNGVGLCNEKSCPTMSAGR